MEIIEFVPFILLCFGAPIALTTINICNLFFRKKIKPKVISMLTLIVGGVMYYLLFGFTFDTAGDWNERIYAIQKHYSISSEYLPSIAIPVLLALGAIMTITFIPAKKIPPLVSAILTALIIIGNVIQIIYAVQISENVRDIEYMLYVYHLNILLISVQTIHTQVKEQTALISKRRERLTKPWQIKAYTLLEKTANMRLFMFAMVFVAAAALEILMILFGQGADGAIKAFTDTADWTFSQQIPPPPLEYEGHYLCTVAAGGHKKVVKPLRFGKRHGAVIVVNRQLCVANAFEDLIHERTPKFHKKVRNFYDTHGYPLSKIITTPLRADIVYVLMKPLEWIFLIVLYTFDPDPEKRISVQYRL